MIEVRRALRGVAIPVAVVLGLLGAVLTWVALAGPSASPPSASRDAVAEAGDAAQPPSGRRTSEPQDQRTSQGGVRDLITGPVLPESEPIAVSIPRLGVESSLVDLRLDSSGGMEVPTEAAVAGWYALGPSPGALGPAVIAGHVTWNQFPAVFYRLESLRPGDVVRVERADGRTGVFSVSGLATYAKDRFPSRKVFGTIDHAGLRLITCGGTYDSATRRYLDNVVVFASLVAVE